MRPLAPLVAALLPLAATALDTAPPGPDYLAMNFRAEWRMKPLGEVLDELQKAIEKPVVATSAVQALLQGRSVALVDDRKAPLRDTLLRLEATQDLHFSAEPLRLRVETTGDVLMRRRRPVDLDLAEYGLFASVPDFPSERIGLGSGGGSAGGAGLTASAAPEPAPAHDLQERLKRIIATGDVELNGRTALQVMATPEEETALRKALAEELALNVRRCSWRITWGVAKAGQAVPTGIRPAAEVAPLVAALDHRSSEALHGLAGQRIHGGQMQERCYVDDVQIVSGQQDPTTAVLVTGRMADLRCLPGASLALLRYQLQWADPVGMTEVQVAQGQRVEPGSVNVTLGKDKEAVSSVESAATTIPGSQLAVQLPSAWSWSPGGDVVLPQGAALVLCAEHPLGHAVAIIEEAR